MREVEPARVIALDYIISDDGTSNTCAKLRLQLSDPGSPLQGRTFDIELPPPNCGHAEFVVPKHRFLASVHRKWQVGDCCQVCACSGTGSVAGSVAVMICIGSWSWTSVCKSIPVPHSFALRVAMGAVSVHSTTHTAAVQSLQLCELFCHTGCYRFSGFRLLILRSPIRDAADA